MTSERKIAANRRNARQGRGPQTAAGKARASRNALRHGLAALNYLDPARARHIECLARAMCGEDDKNPALLEQARTIAESEMMLRCVRAEKITAIERLRDPSATARAKPDDRIARAKAKMRSLDIVASKCDQLTARFLARPAEERRKLEQEYEIQKSELAVSNAPIEKRDEFDAMHEAMPDLTRLMRYERRALSQRKRALRKFLDIKSGNDIG